jgi:importin-5
MNHVAGEQCMDRLANRLGGATLLPPTFNWLPRMAQSSNWRDRHACLMAISAISEGCRDSMLPQLAAVLDMVTPAVQDPHPRVRWAACNALGQMSTDFAGVMQEKHHKTVMLHLIPVLDAPEPRVKAHAAAALVNFCEEAEKDILEPYLDELIHRLLSLLSNEKRYVQEQALSTIATVADSAETAFTRYYDMLMPLLFNVVNRPNTAEDKDTRLLTAKAMECASLIALAVGKERLGGDATALVTAFARIQQNITDPDDPQASYLLHCWGRMCRVMGDDFLPYLPGVMPPLLELASAKADVQLFDDDEQIQAMEQEEGWELVPVRGRCIGIKTSILEDKHLAIELLITYAQQLQAAFEPYVIQVLRNIALPGLVFLFNDPVRLSSAALVPHLVNSYRKVHGVQSTEFGQLWRETLAKVFDALESEPAVEPLAQLFQCFYECVDVIGQGALTSADMEKYIVLTEKAIQEYQLRVQSRLEEACDGDDNFEENDEMLFAIEDDQTLLSDMNKAFHIIFKHHGTTFIPFWERLIRYYQEFLCSADPTQRQWALCIIDDVIEFCGPASWKYMEHFLKPLVDGLGDDSAANRQAAAYGVGIAAKCGGPAYAEFVAACVPKLFEVVKHPHAREEDHIYATENACATIAKILKYNSSHVQNASTLIGPWLDTLPIISDEEAAPYAYAFLAELVQRYVQHLFPYL